jgi:threonine/homoserine/homoserine lactone efflux protein
VSIGGCSKLKEEPVKPAKEESKMADVVGVVAGLCLAVIAMGLVFADSRQFAIEFGSVVFLVLVAAGVGVLAHVGWVMVRHARRRHEAGRVGPRAG